jgi:hypothetical protein
MGYSLVIKQGGKTSHKKKGFSGKIIYKWRICPLPHLITGGYAYIGYKIGKMGNQGSNGEFQDRKLSALESILIPMCKASGNIGAKC